MFWQPRKLRSGESSVDRGTCHRFPPNTVTMPGDRFPHHYHPATLITDWCGEFEEHDDGR